MATYFPIKLVGNNLGQRHRYLNDLVSDAHKNKVTIQSIQSCPEETPVDRIFKIALASKYHDIDYILKTLKDEDMLYVSKALKWCTWLIKQQYADIINPSYLENNLYNDMTTTAVNKMKHWLQHNLRDPERCEEFYGYYKINAFKIAAPFLWHCSNQFILNEFPNILNNINPHLLKCLYEKCPDVAKVFISKINTDLIVTKKYIDDEGKYFSCLKGLLKINPESYLNYIEKYHSEYTHPLLSPAATTFIMNNHKNRFNEKSELYTSRLLNMKALGSCLKTEEIKELILKLAKAEFLSSWFSYKTVEPLIKYLNVEERKLLKNQIFVEKNIGEKVKEWPYATPTRPEIKDDEKHIFQDTEHDQCEYEYLEDDCSVGGFRSRLMKRKMCSYMERAECCIPAKTLLDQLFDKYRFDSFDHTLFELRKQITAESSSQNRQYMLLVLVSKSGGREDNVLALLKLLTTRHSNETSNLRAAIVRSLVRRAYAWRLSAESWKLLLDFAKDLGLDGNPPTANCREGLHAVVLRQLLTSNDCEPKILKAFFSEFSSLIEYSLNPSEKSCIRKYLPCILLKAAESDTDNIADRLSQILDLMIDHNIRFTDCPSIIDAIATLAQKDFKSANLLIRRLFDARVARKQLFKENFELIQTDQSYVNALKHDISVFSVDKYKLLIERHDFRHECFLRKIAIYFNEEGGIALQCLSSLDSFIPSEIDVKLGRPIARLAGCSLKRRIDALDEEHKESKQRRLAASIRANSHLTRPPFDIHSFGWKRAGAKAVENRVVVTSKNNVPKYLKDLVSWRNTAKISYAVAQRVGQEVVVFESLKSSRPQVALKLILRYFNQSKGFIDERVWPIAKELIEKLNLTDSKNKRLRKSLLNIEKIPLNIKTDYCLTLYETLQKESKEKAMPILCALEKLLPKLSEKFVITIVEEFLQNYFVEEKLATSAYGDDVCFLYVRIIIKFLLLSRTDLQLLSRLEVVGEPFFDRIESLWKSSKKSKTLIVAMIDELLSTLKYNEVFLNDEYQACYNVFEFILKKMKIIFPMEKCFKLFIQVHITMLYYKSIRQCLKNKPEYLKNDSMKRNEGVEMVGKILGKYISCEIDELVKNYFPSIREIYKEEVHKYFSNYFTYGENKNKFIKQIVKGIVEEESVNGTCIAFYLYRASLNDENLLKVFENSKSNEFKFFLYADKIYN